MDLLSLIRGEAADLHVKNRISCDRTYLECFLHCPSQLVGVALDGRADLNDFPETIQHLELGHEDLATR